ncbi:MAG: hypothetical protein KKF54_01505 [Candidatus Omnitrophica bacterium]|nr:hypothetical protein [Candidatus Omnitrophota bacterium]
MIGTLDVKNKMMLKNAIKIIIIIFFFSSLSVFALDDYPIIPKLKGYDVVVITDSISCSRLARYIMQQNYISESSLREADLILTVVRSSLNWPLDSSYDSIGELKKDIESQLNISGSNGHIYVYEINNDLSVYEIFHSGFEWENYIDDL